MTGDRLFDPEDSVGDVAGRAAPRARAEFLVGMLAFWTFGDSKPKKAQLDALHDIASEALARATAIK